MADNLNGRPKGIQTALINASVTLERPPYSPAVGHRKDLPSAGTARVNKAISVESPGGTSLWSEEHAQQTVLQQHCAFFDRDADGVISPLDTFRGLRLLGFALVLCAVGALGTHLLLSYATSPSVLPDPLLRIHLQNIHRAKHGSDSGVYDSEGRFIPQKFEDFFSKYGKGKDGVTLNDIRDALKGMRVLMDPVGWFCTFMAWTWTYMLLWPEDGFLRKDDIRRVFDGSIFQDIAEGRKAKKESTKKGE
ncbi:Caleosin-domain-containing protein [Epithele typhae]|uniref:Caleosin-domain-containing protein n=1 Tax=Epithele typhae TaxID=378194 RepID=UPI0020078640|nr:Caleosin-domain-containing protein [Epithele typhae]KAH9940430.1 Caleosin-domain-containing protein [Epithele typhae]